MRLSSIPASRHTRLLASVLGLGLAFAPLAVQAAPKAPAMSTYKTAAAAKAACKGDTVVWHTSGSKVFHNSTSKYFGKTKHGAYACEKAAMAHGLHAGKS